MIDRVHSRLPSRLVTDPSAIGSQGNAILGIRDTGKSYTATKLAEELIDAGVPIVAFDPIGIWRFLRRPGNVHCNGRGYPVVVAGGSEGDLPLTVETAPAIVRAAMLNGISLVIDLFDINLSKADWRRIVKTCIKVLVHENRPYGLRHVFIEEAAEFAPQRVIDGEVYAAVEQLGRMGGNSRLGYTLINQRAEEVNKAVLELCDNLFLHRQKGKNSLASLTKWLDVADVGNAREIIKSLPSLPQGECWAWMAGSHTPRHIKVPAKNSMHPDRRVMRGDDRAHNLLEFGGPQRVDVDEFVAKMSKALAPKSVTSIKAIRDPGPALSVGFKPKEDEVTKEEADALRAENADLKRRVSELEHHLALVPAGQKGNDPGTHPLDMDAIWAEVKRRASSLQVLALLAQKPELKVSVTRHVVTADGASAMGMTARLISEGYFNDPKTAQTAWNEVKRYGFNGAAARIYEACEKLTGMGFLTFEGKGVGFRVVTGMKINIVEGSDA